MPNIQINDPSEKRISLVYDSNTDSYKALDIDTLSNAGSTISNHSPATSFGTILNANTNREELYVQNLSTEMLYVKYGANASTGSFNFVLAGNSKHHGGDGGSLSDLNYTGIVSVTGTSLQYIAWERS